MGNVLTAEFGLYTINYQPSVVAAAAAHFLWNVNFTNNLFEMGVHGDMLICYRRLMQVLLQRMSTGE
jgi:hypothetical protein